VDETLPVPVAGEPGPHREAVPWKATAVSAPVGTLLSGRYRLDARIGHGGMSTVYRAFDTVLERQVAIKVMHREVSTESDQLERFRREARAVAQLNHQHIVTVIDAGEDEGTAYIVFEYVDGETLKDRIRREGALPVSEAIAYAIEIARALECAHTHHIVHRDVKPQNVLLDSEGSAKITDFGIARTLTEEGLTADGRVLGTTDYVSPEQALGHPVEGQSDLYSLGVVLYEMLTGDVPYRGETPVAVAMKHVREQVPDVQTRRTGVSAALAAVVDRATAKDLRRRYPDAASMSRDLEEALAIEAARSGQATGEATSVLRSLPGPARRRLPLNLRLPTIAPIAALVAILLLVGVALYDLAHRTHRGTGVAPLVVTPAHTAAIRLSQTAAHDYNPFGTGPENPNMIQFVIDNDPSTSWSTEQYYDGTLRKQGGVGVGLYVDAQPGVIAKEIELQTPTPGFTVQIYGANHIATFPYGNSTPLAARGWQGPLGQSSSVRDGDHVLIATGGRRFRYYLVWLTQLPPGQQAAQISELTLFAQVPAQRR
jgi:tRNA A-37 threonylcarbamoyl transferase component Bud32